MTPEQETKDQESPHVPDTSWTMPKLARFEWVILWLVGLGAAAGGVIGLYSSFGNVTKHMADKGFEHPELVPIAVDIMIPVFGFAYLMLLRLRMGLAWVRWVPYLLTGVTIYLNIASSPELDAQVAHAALPALWVGFTEVIAHFYRVQIGRAAGTRADPIPLIRWMIAFPSTFRLWRLMMLWGITSYTEMLELERTRVRAVSALRTKYGRTWRYQAPLEFKTELGLGALTASHVTGVTAIAAAETTTARNESSQQPTPPNPASRQQELENSNGPTNLPNSAKPLLTDNPTPLPNTPPWDGDWTQEGQEKEEQEKEEERQIETKEEREQREEAEEQREQDERARQAASDANYHRTAELVIAALEAGAPLRGLGSRIAREHSVGARTVQRHIRVMREHGLLPEEAEDDTTTAGASR